MQKFTKNSDIDSFYMLNMRYLTANKTLTVASGLFYYIG